jgi:hypothetical protein
MLPNCNGDIRRIGEVSRWRIRDRPFHPERVRVALA